MKDLIDRDLKWYEMSCDACCPAHCGFESQEESECEGGYTARDAGDVSI